MSPWNYRSPPHNISPILTLLFICIGLSVSEPSYKLLSTTLPKTLQAHITGIYRDTLFLFGGNPVVMEGDKRYNMKWYKLDLKSLQMSLNANKTDITSVTGSWTEISGVTMPDYGPQGRGGSHEGKFWCARSQCSAVVGPYLFVVTPGHADSPYSNHRYIYRIDLSQDPPAFANETDFQSSIVGNGVSTPCVTTDGTHLYYAGGCSQVCHSAGATPENNVYKYDVSADSHQLVFGMSTNYNIYKSAFGCAWNYHMYKEDSFRLYFVMGDDGTNSGYLGDYEYYDNTTQSWSGSIDLDAHRNEPKCTNNPFTSTIECGTGMFSYDTYNNVTLIDGGSFDRTVTLYQSVRGYTIEHYIIYLTATEGCAVMLVLGGVGDGSFAVYNYMQYAVRCAPLDGTDPPTIHPSSSPTRNPSVGPTSPPTTSNPTPAPSRNPSVAPTPPTMAPTSPLNCDKSHTPDIIFSISIHRSMQDVISWENERSFLKEVMDGSSQYGGGIGIQTFGDTATDLLGGVVDIVDDTVFDAFHQVLANMTVVGTDGNDVSLAMDMATTTLNGRDSTRQSLHVIILNADPISADVCATSVQAKQANIRTYVIAIGEDMWDFHKGKLVCLVQDPSNDIFVVDPIHPNASVSSILSILCDKEYDVRITEIKVEDKRYIEGYNFGAAIPSDMLDIWWSINGTQSTSNNTQEIPQGSFFVFHDPSDSGQPIGGLQFDMDFGSKYSKVNWSVAIKLKTDTEYMDAVSWASDSFTIAKDEFTYKLRHLGYNNDHGANWQTSCTERGTPNEKNEDEACMMNFGENGWSCSDYLCHINDNTNTGECNKIGESINRYCRCNRTGSFRLWGDGFSCRNFPKTEDGYCVAELGIDKSVNGSVLNINWPRILYDGIVEYFVQWETTSGAISNVSVGGVTSFTTNDFKTTNVTMNYANIYAKIENPDIYYAEYPDEYFYHVLQCEIYTQAPTTEPTTDPTNEPTFDPTIDPTQQPTLEPTQGHVGTYLFTENITNCAVPRCECDGQSAFCCFVNECEARSKSIKIPASVDEIETDVNIQVYPDSLSSNVEIDVVFAITQQSNAMAVEFAPLGLLHRSMKTRVGNTITEVIDIEIKSLEILCTDFDEKNASHYVIQIINCTTADSTTTPFVDWCETIYPSQLDLFIYRSDCSVTPWTTDEPEQSDEDDAFTWRDVGMVYLVTIGLILMMALIVFCGLCHAKCIRKNDFFQVIALSMFGVQVMDTFYDVVFAYQLTEDPEFVVGFSWDSEYFLFFIFSASVLFIIVPLLISYVQLTVEIRRKWMKIPEVRAWLLRFNTLLYMMLFVCGNAFNATLLMNSNLCSIIIFDLPLNKLQIIEFQTQRVYSVLLFENLPQFVLQALYIVLTGGRNNVVWISMSLSLLSIIVSITTSMQQQEIVKSQNATKITFEIEGQFDVKRCKNRVNDIRAKTGRVLGVDENVILVPKPVEIPNGLKMTLYILMNKEKAEEMKFNEKMHNARKSGKMNEIIEGSWKAKTTKNMDVKNVQCSIVVPGQDTITLPRAGTVTPQNALEDGLFIEMEERAEPVPVSHESGVLVEEGEDEDSEEYHPPEKVNWKLQAKQGAPK